MVQITTIAPKNRCQKKTESLSKKHVDHCQNNTIIQSVNNYHLSDLPRKWVLPVVLFDAQGPPHDTSFRIDHDKLLFGVFHHVHHVQRQIQDVRHPEFRFDVFKDGQKINEGNFFVPGEREREY
jgi:hypothetical protein